MPRIAGFEDVRALTFDLMGTCTDWHTAILAALHRLAPSSSLDVSALALDWRAGFFRKIHESFAAGEHAPDIDEVHRTVLDELLEIRGIGSSEWDDVLRKRLVSAWHEQLPWSDSEQGLSMIRKQFPIAVLANGTTHLQISIVRSAGIQFDMLFSSQLLQATKPDPNMYLKALSLLDLPPTSVVMVAAHAYDLRAAARVGMKTVYIQRKGEDPGEDMDTVRREVDLFVDGTTNGGGMLELARLLECH